MELPPDAPAIRLCHLTKWKDFQGYGFNLHTDKTKNIQTLGDIDKGSPAEAAGLMKGDRIVEVNGQNVFNENHRQVVERIKAYPDETRLLVVDAASDQWYRERDIIIKGSLPSVKSLTSSKDSPVKNMTNGSSTPPSNMAAASPSVTDGPYARLCHLRKWPDFDGYGFNLHADKVKGTQFIGVIDANSPAETAGMKQDDKIIEVNGENVEKLSHRDLVERIKAVPNETTLLVVDDIAYEYLRSKRIQISSHMQTNLKTFETPSSNPRNKTAVNNNNNLKEMDSSKVPPMPPMAEPVDPKEVEAKMAKELVPRKCLLRKWPDFEGYGFNLHADKTKQLHFIGEVDEGSPAKLGGLKPDDRLVEVNGLSVQSLNHREIIERIKSNPNETELLVIDREADERYEAMRRTPKGDQPDVICLSTPLREPKPENDESSKTSTPKMIPSTPSSNRSEELPPATPSTTLDDYEILGVNSPSPANNVVPPEYSETRNDRSSIESPMMEKELQTRTSELNISGNNHNSSNNNNTVDTHDGMDNGAESPIFSMKASDYREMLRQQRKKNDPRLQNMDLMEKFKIMEQL